MSEFGTTILSITSRTDIPPHSPYIQSQLEEYKTIIIDKIQNLVAERITTSKPVAYATK